MGPAKYRGIGWNGSSVGGAALAAPTAPGNGSGGAGALGIGNGGGLEFSAARGEISDALAGQITLGIVNLALLAMVGFYVYTRSIQAGA